MEKVSQPPDTQDITISELYPPSATVTVIFELTMVPGFVLSKSTDEYGRPTNCGVLSFTSSTGISLLNETVFGSAPPTDSSKKKKNQTC